MKPEIHSPPNEQPITQIHAIVQVDEDNARRQVGSGVATEGLAVTLDDEAGVVFRTGEGAGHAYRRRALRCSSR